MEATTRTGLVKLRFDIDGARLCPAQLYTVRTLLLRKFVNYL